MLVKRMTLVPAIVDGQLAFETKGPVEEIELSELLKEPEVIKRLIEMDFERLKIQQSAKTTGEGRNLRFK